MKQAHLLVPTLSLVLAAQTPTPVRTRATFQDPAHGLEVVQGELLLRPARPWPQLRLAPGETGVTQVFLVPPDEALIDPQTRKARLEERQSVVNGAVRPLQNNRILARALAVYGKAHDGVGPASLDEPAWLEAVAGPQFPAGTDSEARKRLIAQRNQTLSKNLTGFVLVPRARLGQAQPLFLEATPLIDDGRHWVVDSQLQANRVPIDKALCAKAKLTVDRSKAIPVPSLPDPTRPLPFMVLALRQPGAKSARLELLPESGPAQPLTWALGGGSHGSPALLGQWAQARNGAWNQGAGDPSPLLAGFQEIQARQIGAALQPPPNEDSQNRDQGLSLLSLLGGRAAIQETLQLDRDLRGSAGAAPAAPVVLADLPGVPAEAHPWKTMLPSSRMAVPELALCVPMDRGLLLLPQPKAALDELAGGGSNFLARVNAFSRQGSLDRDLIAKAQEDLGLGSGLGRRLLEAGGIRELAVFFPDLNFLGGMDLTVIAELTPAATPLVGLVIGAEPQPVATPRGQAWRALLGQRLFLSTSRSELDLAMALQNSGGRGSLGGSDEFQVMLARLAPDAATRAYAYFSDPFIRRLVGPAQRILQMRQAKARHDLETVAAGVELRRLDQPGAPLDPASLRTLGYLPADLDLAGISVDGDGQVHSETWGSLARMRPVPTVPPRTVAAWEAEAYGRFRDQYSQYWRRYFDPIALRLDARAEAGYDLETFILPLLDESAYQALRRLLNPGPEPVLKQRPQWTQPQVATFSLPADWTSLLGLEPVSYRRSLALPIPEQLVAALGNEAHLAFLDAAPVVQIGGGSPAGLLDSPERLTQGGLMFLAPLLLGPLTRPVVLAVPVRDRAAAQAGLSQVAQAVEAFNGRHRSSEFEWRVHQESDHRLILSGSLFGVVSLRASIELQDQWLVICNDTSQPSPLVTGSVPATPAHAALTLRPGDLRLGLSAAWQAAVEGQADRAWADQRWLAPWLGSGLSLEAARNRSNLVFGGAPLLKDSDLGPGPEPANLRYGSPHRALLPARQPGEDFGLFEGLREMRVDMAFEADGLRARVTWLPSAQ